MKRFLVGLCLFFFVGAAWEVSAFDETQLEKLQLLGESCPSCDLSWAKLSNEDLSGRNLTEIGQDPKRVRQLVESDQVKKSYFEQTDIAREKGIFGSPTCVVGSELFWGDDRIEDALWWLKNG